MQINCLHDSTEFRSVIFRNGPTFASTVEGRNAGNPVHRTTFSGVERIGFAVIARELTLSLTFHSEPRKCVYVAKLVPGGARDP